MAVFTKIDARVWSDPMYVKLSDDGKLLFLYVLSCTHRNMIGLYSLPVPYGSFDLGWDSERFTKGLQELSDKGFINYNFDTHIIFIKNFLKYNPLENPNQVKGAIKVLDTIPANGISKDLIRYLKTLDKPFMKPLVELLDKRFTERLGKQEEEEEDVEEDVYVYVDDYDNKDKKESVVVVVDKDINKKLSDCGFKKSANTKKIITSLKENYSKEWILEAIEISDKQDARRLSYVNGILKNWKEKGKNKKPLAKGKDFEEREYDYDKLETKLLGWD